MNAKPIIEITGLGKKYPIVHDKLPYSTLRDSIVNFIKHPFSSRRTRESFWALRDINLTINRGDIIGIIGKNGAGKSTLLKILSGITKPTEGKVKLYGRVSSLLEVGTGFHPELTGRENIYLNGVILGMTRKEVSKKFDEIVAFAGIEKFLDTPVKHYSSGMYVRLAFAVAAHLEPDILIVDEVLAVGDIEFQKKCLGKMEEVSKEEGRTVIFVSHNMGAIEQLCSKTLILNSGYLERIGKTAYIIDLYLNKDRNSNFIKEWTNGLQGDQNVIFTKIKLVNHTEDVCPTVIAEESFSFEIEYEIIKPIKNLQIGLQLIQESKIIFETSDVKISESPNITREIGKYKSICIIPKNLLNSCTYSISLFAHIPKISLIAKEERVINFTVSTREKWSGVETQPGFIRPNLEWKIIKTL